MKVKDCTLTSSQLKELMDKYNENINTVSTKFNILERVIMQCIDKSDDTLI